MSVVDPPAPHPYSHELNWPEGMAPMKVIDDDGSMAEPFAQYAWMREHAPVVRMKTKGEDVWMLTRYEDVRKASRAPKIFGSKMSEETPLTFLPLFDAPEHTRLRQVYARAFNPKSVALVEGWIRTRASTIVDEFVADGGGDVIERVCVPLTMSTIGGILDIPSTDIHKMKFWSDEVFALHAPSRSLPTTPTAKKNAGEFFVYLEDRLERLYAEESESVGGHLARMWKEGQISAKEAREMCAFLFIAGHDTTTLLIGNGLRQLIADPRLIPRIRKEPEDAALFVEELARYYGTIHRTTRRLTEQVEVAGVVIPKGAIVRLGIASADRDGSKFPKPDEFDIDRDTGGHLGFGFGVHSCIGAPLARLETRILIQTLSQRIDRMYLVGDHPVELMPGHMFTLGPKHLTVGITPVGA